MFSSNGKYNLDVLKSKPELKTISGWPDQLHKLKTTIGGNNAQGEGNLPDDMYSMVDNNFV